MKKIVFTFVLSMICIFGMSASVEAASKTIKKTVIEGETCEIRTPSVNRKISSVSVAKSGKAYLSAKRTKDKKAVSLKGIQAYDKPITVTVKVGKKKYKYSVTVAMSPSASEAKAPVSDTVKAYHNDGVTCTCGGAWEKITLTDTYKPSFWYLGAAETLKDDTAQTWTKNAVTTDCYYPLRVSAVEAGYNYDRSDLKWRGYDDSGEVALCKGTIPMTLDGKNILQGHKYPTTESLQWTTARGGQVAKMSVDNYAQTQVIDTGFYKCVKCGAIKQ